MQRKKTFPLAVVQNSIVSQEFDLPREVGTVVGIALSGSREDLVYARGSAEVIIAGQDIIKGGERCSQYMYGVDNPTRYFAFGELPLVSQDKTLRVRYQDQDNPDFGFSAHTAEVILTYIVATTVAP